MVKKIEGKQYTQPTIDFILLVKQDVLLVSGDNRFDEKWDNESPTIPF